ncbi:PREDICTED: uncharacterized protein LOC106816855 isoform X3 [Priapulus caudatus]|uniref:Uncharacterized protein LOC106816855 isoform X3 n=1 Tax=Priapulus caudatus TaxID=37621 RepID=A0ABM1EXR2_PRICU|nr:PREDICTED: uncharacterized protein LOC106816855 isoform X3 [Priapulus caudatus]
MEGEGVMIVEGDMAVVEEVVLGSATSVGKMATLLENVQIQKAVEEAAAAAAAAVAGHATNVMRKATWQEIALKVVAILEVEVEAEAEASVEIAEMMAEQQVL